VEEDLQCGLPRWTNRGGVAPESKISGHCHAHPEHRVSLPIDRGVARGRGVLDKVVPGEPLGEQAKWPEPTLSAWQGTKPAKVLAALNGVPGKRGRLSLRAAPRVG
jgi:hypothetical protein